MCRVIEQSSFLFDSMIGLFIHGRKPHYVYVKDLVFIPHNGCKGFACEFVSKPYLW